jgi:hypothetical protein
MVKKGKGGEMTKWMFTQCAMKIYCSLLLFAPLISFAQPKYNVVKDYGFENNDTIWVDYESHINVIADRHNPFGYKSDHSGLTDTDELPPAVTGFMMYGYLEQKLIKRTAKDYNLDKNLKYFLKVYIPNAPDYYDYWYISIRSSKNILIYLYTGYLQDNVPDEDDTTHIVKVDYPKNSSWKGETLNFYKNWTEKFSEDDTVEKIRFASYGFRASHGDHGQRVWWDDIVFESTRPDSDAAVVDISFTGNPTAKIQNNGAAVVSFPTICDIFQGSTNRVYSDTVNVDSLSVDSIKQVSFNPYSDTGEMKIYTVLPGDQNPANDTLSKNLCVQEKATPKLHEFRVWPTLTRGMINYESDKPVYVYDPTGRMLTKTEKGEGKILLKNAGIYFLKSGSAVTKVIAE